jgi:hypothetical protein
MGLDDKAAAFKLIEREIAVMPIEKDALDGLVPIEILARVGGRAWANPTAPSPLYRNYSRHRTKAHWLGAPCPSLPRCSGSIQCSIHFGMIRASKNSPSRNHRNNSANFSDNFGHKNCVILRENSKAAILSECG